MDISDVAKYAGGEYCDGEGEQNGLCPDVILGLVSDASARRRCADYQLACIHRAPNEKYGNDAESMVETPTSACTKREEIDCGKPSSESTKFLLFSLLQFRTSAVAFIEQRLA